MSDSRRGKERSKKLSPGRMPMAEADPGLTEGNMCEPGTAVNKAFSYPMPS